MRARTVLLLLHLAITAGAVATAPKLDLRSVESNRARIPDGGGLELRRSTAAPLPVANRDILGEPTIARRLYLLFNFPAARAAVIGSEIVGLTGVPAWLLAQLSGVLYLAVSCSQWWLIGKRFEKQVTPGAAT